MINIVKTIIKNIKNNCFEELKTMINNEENIKSLISKGFDIRIIEKDVYNFDFDLAKAIIECYVYDNNFIVNLLTFYKNNRKFTKEQFEEFINTERFGVRLPYQWYQKSIFQKQYNQLEYFYYYDEKISLIYNIKNITNYNEKEFPNFMVKLYEFFKKVKYHELKISIDINYINKILDKILIIKRQLLTEIIINNNMSELSKFFERNEILIDDINSSNYDVLTEAIKYGLPTKYIDKIINLFSYSILDYEIPNNIFGYSLTPAVYSIILEKYDICSFLISQGADNYIISISTWNIII
ncbi:hypothetical protein PIROE2DRAFT_17556 [Piromyces sp. E2]|nr:hypothetical protein PIROE2DRAFT_17556 [Piromyces sp. E2]|eukprot:OUM57462.1 hypothetical protein PIROE2DRAFT_17556 [Piromyces sp. E2]